jgi:hypothetical protein
MDSAFPISSRLIRARPARFARPHPLQFLLEARGATVAGKFRRAEVPGGKIRKRHADDATPFEGGGQVVVLARLQNLRVDGRARRHHAGHFTLHQLLGQARIFHLIADRDAVAAPDELGNVTFGGVVGHPAHGYGHPLFLVAGGQRDLEFARGDHGVFEEEFVEVPQAEQQ